MTTTRTLFAVAVLATALAGCGKTDRPLSGTVTFKGKPVPSGEIMLTPDNSKGNFAPSVLVIIKDGTYETPSDRGHWGGPYRARVSGYGPDPAGREGTGKLLFYNYEVAFDLPEDTATFDIDVPAGAATK